MQNIKFIKLLSSWCEKFFVMLHTSNKYFMHNCQFLYGTTPNISLHHKSSKLPYEISKIPNMKNTEFRRFKKSVSEYVVTYSKRILDL